MVRDAKVRLSATSARTLSGGTIDGLAFAQLRATLRNKRFDERMKHLQAADVVDPSGSCTCTPVMHTHHLRIHLNSMAAILDIDRDSVTRSLRDNGYYMAHPRLKREHIIEFCPRAVVGTLQANLPGAAPPFMQQQQTHPSVSSSAGPALAPSQASGHTHHLNSLPPHSTIASVTHSDFHSPGVQSVQSQQGLLVTLAARLSAVENRVVTVAEALLNLIALSDYEAAQSLRGALAGDHAPAQSAMSRDMQIPQPPPHMRAPDVSTGPAAQYPQYHAHSHPASSAAGEGGHSANMWEWASVQPTHSEAAPPTDSSTAAMSPRLPPPVQGFSSFVPPGVTGAHAMSVDSMPQAPGGGSYGTLAGAMGVGHPMGTMEGGAATTWSLPPLLGGAPSASSVDALRTPAHVTAMSTGPVLPPPVDDPGRGGSAHRRAARRASRSSRPGDGSPRSARSGQSSRMTLPAANEMAPVDDGGPAVVYVVPGRGPGSGPVVGDAVGEADRSQDEVYGGADAALEEAENGAIDDEGVGGGGGDFLGGMLGGGEQELEDDDELDGENEDEEGLNAYMQSGFDVGALERAALVSNIERQVTRGMSGRGGGAAASLSGGA